MSERYQRILNGVSLWAGYYRANIHRFAADYLHLELKWFQKILLFMMNICLSAVYIGSRGQGKTWLCAIYCCCRAILYPHSKICLASGTRGQAFQILEKIQTDLVPMSPELKEEIDWKASRFNGTQAIVFFKNGSFIKVVTSGESARGNRAHILILDEFRLIDKDTIDTILRKFLSSKREPLYLELTKEEKIRQKEKEQLQTLYFSSGYYQDHWSFAKSADTFVRMLSGRKEFIAGLPWQLAVDEGLLDMEDVEAQMSEADYNEIKWAMEMDAMFWGAGDGSFFEYDSVSKNRHIKYPMLPASLAEKLAGSKNAALVRIPPKQQGELRLLSADIALMSSKKHANDATAIFINQMVPTKSGRYTNNIVYTVSMEGVRGEDQALLIRKLYDEFDCDYIVLDTNGVGMTVYESLSKDLVDPDTGEQYPALSCCNDQTMAERCTVIGAPKVIWSIKAGAQLNNDCAVLLRDGFRSGRIRLLINEYEADEVLSEISGYAKLNPPEKLKLQMPYINTTLLIDELVRLQHDESGGKVKISEKAGMRKDRYSSLAYNYYVAIQLENRMQRRSSAAGSLTDKFRIKPPSSYHGKAVSGTHGRNKQRAWF